MAARRTNVMCLTSPPVDHEASSPTYHIVVCVSSQYEPVALTCHAREAEERDFSLCSQINDQSKELEALEVERERVTAQTDEIDRFVEDLKKGKKKQIVSMKDETGQHSDLGKMVRSRGRGDAMRLDAIDSMRCDAMRCDAMRLIDAIDAMRCDAMRLIDATDRCDGSIRRD